MMAFSIKTFSFCSGELVFCVTKHKNKRASKKYALRYTNDLPTLMTGWTFHKMQWALDGEGVLNFIVEEMKNYKSTDIRILLNESPSFEIEFDNLFYKPIPKGMNYLAPPIFSPNFDIKYVVKQLHKNGVKTSPELTPFEIMCLYIENGSKYGKKGLNNEKD